MYTQQDHLDWSDIRQTIESYESSCDLVRERICELSLQINQLPENQQQKDLVRRRYTLYTELWDMQGTLKELREYAGISPLRRRAPSH